MGKSAQDRASRLEKELGSKRFWTAPVGDFTIRVLPTPANKKGDDDLFLEYFMHENVGKEKRFLRCGKDASGKGKCYLCDKVIPKLRSAGKDQRAAALEPKPKVAVQIAVVSKDGSMDGPHMWLPNKKVQRGLVAKVFNNRKRDLTDPKKGRNLGYKRVGTGQKDTDYFGPDVDDEGTPVPKDIMKKLVAFEDAKKNGNLIFYKYSEEDQKKAYEGTAASSSASESASASESGSAASASGSASESASGSDASSSEEASSSEKKKDKKKGKGKSKSKSKKGSSSEESSSDASSSEEASSSDASSSEEGSDEGSDASSSEESSS